MPEYKAPGVFIEESNAGPRPIEGVSTTTAAFVGFVWRSSVNRRQPSERWPANLAVPRRGEDLLVFEDQAG